MSCSPPLYVPMLYYPLLWVPFQLLSSHHLSQNKVHFQNLQRLTIPKRRLVSDLWIMSSLFFYTEYDHLRQCQRIYPPSANPLLIAFHNISTGLYSMHHFQLGLTHCDRFWRQTLHPGFTGEEARIKPFQWQHWTTVCRDWEYKYTSSTWPCIYICNIQFYQFHCQIIIPNWFQIQYIGSSKWSSWLSLVTVWYTL